MTSTDLAAVLAAPEDLAPRWALMRTLRRAGDPRGRFIELQLEASMERKRSGASREYWSLESTADAMLARHREEWTREIAPLVEQARFHRGFVESVTIDAHSFLTRGARLYELAPIRCVTLKNAKDLIPDLTASPLLRPLAALGLQANPIGDDGARALASCAHLGNLRLLDISFGDVTDAGLEAIAGSKHLARLVFVNLAGNRCRNPVEDYGLDPMSGSIVPSPGSLPQLGKELEARFGPLAWLHAPSLLLTYPPTVEDV
jgi:hypothetical protein